MTTEIDKLDPLPESVTLQSGLVVRLEALKTRQFLKLLRIITHGGLSQLGGQFIGSLISDADESDSVEEFMGRLLSAVLFAVPDAEDETIVFLRAMCYPDGLVEKRALTRPDVEHNKTLWAGLDAELENPELEDTITIIEAIVRREAEDIQALGKRLMTMFNLAQKTGQVPSSSPSPSESTSESSEDSPEPSTSSRRRTGGRTTKSVTSPLLDSDNASPRSARNSTTRVGSASIG